MTTKSPLQAKADLNFTISFISSLQEITCAAWNALIEDDNPFLRYEFLDALERNDCLGEKFGWYPHHLIVRNCKDTLIAAIPIYIKTNSYGEFVFDWSWASAYQQSGLNYYPKLVSSIPYTPATGNRLLITPDFPANMNDQIAARMINACIEEARQLEMSGMHWLFNQMHECKYFKQQNLMQRLGCQYHWYNQGYESFEQFLSTLTSRKRKKIKRERRYVHEQSITIKQLHGNEISEGLWQQIHMFYVSTFYRKSGFPTLSLEFFKELGSTMGQQILLVLAYSDKRLVACSINFHSSHTLYGRFWGCVANFHSLHFEACYYQGIEYAINNKLTSFEPGAQGEYKISRGFLPTKTWSAHWIADPRFTLAIEDFCKREASLMQQECGKLMSMSPYRLD